MPDKKAVRRAAKERRLQLDPEQIRVLSERIAAKVTETQAFQKARTVCLYIPIHHEADTRPIREAARKAVKRVAAPRICGGVMDFYYFEKETELAPGFCGIPEPQGQEAVKEPALIILPGVAFDPACHRIGYGGGYYDRYLAAHPEHETLAIAFSCQMEEQVPCEPYDIQPHFVVTEDTIYSRKE